MGVRIGRGGPGAWAALPTHPFVPLPALISFQIPTSFALLNFLKTKPDLLLESASSNLRTNRLEACPPYPLPAVPAPHCPSPHTDSLSTRPGLWAGAGEGAEWE